MNVKFKTFYNPNRFIPLHPHISSNNLFEIAGGEIIRKTACFFSERFNVFIDSSDGINEDLPINEYCGRIKLITKNFDKPFLYFKCNYSEQRSKDIVSIANENGGKVLPFFIWNLYSQNPKFYSEVLPKRKEWMDKFKSTEKCNDILYAAAKKVYDYPKPNILDKSIAWSDHKNFGLGSPQDTGWFEMHTRDNILEKMKSFKKIKFNHRDKMEYLDYVNEMTKNRAQFSPPGVSEYTCRIFDSAFLGQCSILRKNSYDFYDSWKNYIPEVDLNAKDCESTLVDIIENYKEWGEKAAYYYDNHLSPQNMMSVFMKEVQKFSEEVA